MIYMLVIIIIIKIIIVIINTFINTSLMLLIKGNIFLVVYLYISVYSPFVCVMYSLKY